jgi:hypothetical protein
MNYEDVIQYFFCSKCGLIEEVSLSTTDMIHTHSQLRWILQPISRDEALTILNRAEAEAKWKE